MAKASLVKFENDISRASDQIAESVAATRAKMPGVLFELMCQAQRLSYAGADVLFDLYDSIPAEHTGYRLRAGLQGVVFRFRTEYAHAMGGDWRDYVQYEVLSVEDDEWRVDMVKQRLDELQLEVDEKARQRALAEEAKKLLTPEQLAALKQFG